MVADRHYTPGEASTGALQAHLHAVGAQRVVLVQPSVYGTNNQVLLDALAQLQGRGRGVAVLADHTPPAVLNALHQQGVRGVRLNVESASLRDPNNLWQLLRQWASRVADQGWHVQLYAAFDTLAALGSRLGQLPAPVVLDHFAMAPAHLTPQGAAAQGLQAALDTGRVYVKLSAPYRLAAQVPGADEAAVDRWAQALLQRAPERVLWGTDWPHTFREPGKGPLEVSRFRPLPATDLARWARSWLPTAGLQQRVLVDNPTGLYGA